jgi:transketolase
MIFLTGDLGFMALEPLRSAMGERFINAGVAEQNMMSVAAAMARQDLHVWAYSIAPFCYARPFEQIRNDIAFHHLPVRLIGNGGGYGYGVMGPTHHAIEDYGVLLTLPNLRVYVPAFDEDVTTIVDKAAGDTQAVYLRLGRGEPPEDFDVPDYAPWRQLITGKGPPVIVIGPLVGTYIDALRNMAEDKRPNLWTLTELPLALNPPPTALLDQVRNSGQLYVAEEHVAQGSAAAEFAMCLMERGIPARLTHLHARAHHYARYGSQTYLREQSGLDPQSLLAALGTG